MRLDVGERTAVFERDSAEAVAALEHIRRNALQSAVCRKCDACKIFAPDECLLRNRGDACGHAETIQPRIAECGITDARQGAVFGKRYIAQRIVIGKCVSAYLINRIGDGHSRKRGVLRKRVVLYVNQGFGQLICQYTRAAIESVRTHRFQPFRKNNFRQRAGAIECRLTYHRHGAFHSIRS